MEKILWMPHSFNKCDLEVYLDRDFAQEMIQSRIPNERQRMMNELAKEALEQLGIRQLNPYGFHEDSCFITQFSLGEGGVWLSTGHQNIADLVKGKESPNPINYHSHNVDTPRHAYAFLVLFDKWARYANTLKKS